MNLREQQVYELRLSGKTYREIAVITGYADSSGAYQAYQRARDSITIDSIEEWIQLELERFNALQSALWPKALEGSIPAVNAILKISDQRAKLLGLYSPERFEVNSHQYDSNSLDETMQDMKEMMDYGELYAIEHGIQTRWMK
jgi:hypothetical protein